MKIIPTILCGGAGSRLWPVSREHHPKPFIKLQDGFSFLQKAFMLAAKIPDVTEILTITNHEIFFKTKDDYEAINTTGIHTSYIVEPFGKNTAAAIASAALYAANTCNEDSIILVLAADHLIDDHTAFLQAVAKATHVARLDKLVTFGMEPERPETGFGYIEANFSQPIGAHKNDSISGSFAVSRFIEKPTAENAQRYFESGNFLWNSGMFCFKTTTILKSMRQFCPEIIDAVQLSIKKSNVEKSPNVSKINLEASYFSKVPENSIDYAVMEPASQRNNNDDKALVAVVPCSIGWCDIGSWQTLGALITPDAKGNSIAGEVLLHDVTNSHIQSNDRLIAALGIDELIIIDTADALLVANKNRAQDVKHIYSDLKISEHQTYKYHKTVHRPWGAYTVLEEGPRFKIKRIVVKPGASLSLQMHHHRSEHWIVVSGTAKVLNGDREMLVSVNESTYIPTGNKHRLENPGVVDLIIIEVQSGEYLGEDDIVRFEDNYGRVKTDASQ